MKKPISLERQIVEALGVFLKKYWKMMFLVVYAAITFCAPYNLLLGEKSDEKNNVINTKKEVIKHKR